MKKTKNIEVETVGNSLIEHVRDTSAMRPGLVDELFPYIVQAAQKISTRAISRFLEEKHGVKVSYVTIGRALRNQKKYWNQYFDLIEPAAWLVAEQHNKVVKDFISEPEKYQAMMDEKVKLIVDNIDNPQDSYFRADCEYKNAVAVLDEKWFCFDENILEEARMYLVPRINKKPKGL